MTNTFVARFFSNQLSFLFLFLQGLLGAWIAISDGGNVAGQEFSEELVTRLPHNTLVCVEVPDGAGFLRKLAAGSLGTVAARTPAAKIAGKLIDRQRDDESQTEGPDWSVELEKTFRGKIIFAIFPAEGTSLGYFARIGLAEESLLGKAFADVLRDDPGSLGLSQVEENGAEGFWRHRDGFVLSWSDDNLIFADNVERISRWNQQRPVAGDGTPVLSESRKWVRVRENLGVSKADACGFFDTGRLIELAIQGQANARELSNILRASAVTEALAAGWALRVGEGSADMQLDMFLLCAVPREGILGALSMKPLDELLVPHCPVDSGYALVGRSDLSVLVKSLDDLQTYMMQEHGTDRDSFINGLVAIAPPLALPSIVGESVKDWFTGDFFLFGTGEASERDWFSGLSVGAGLVPGTEEKVLEFLNGGEPPENELDFRTTGDHHWWIENENAWNATADRVRQLEAENGPGSPPIRIPRMALICERERLIRFATDGVVESSLQATDDPASGISGLKEFEEVVSHIDQQRKTSNPSLLFFCRSAELLKWLMFHYVGPGAHFRDYAWKRSLSENRAGRNGLTARAQAALLDQAENWGSADELSDGIGPFGAAIWDQPAGLHASFFLLKRPAK